MNCANHPETPAVSYCQYCGKPLCAECVHKVNNVISCEPCLAARIGVSASAGASGYHFSQTPEGMSFSDGKGGYFRQGPGYQHYSSGPAGTFVGTPDIHPWGTNPWAAFWLGWIPGVGAIYNGQMAKGLAHVVIFAILVSLAHWNGVIGIVVAAWLFYQAFDAYHTAVARRDGLPLPNPLGLNDIGHWFGARGQGWYAVNGSGSNAGTAPQTGSAAPPQSVAGNTPASGFTSGFAPPYAAPVPPVPPIPPVPPNPENTGLWCSGGRGVPTGAIVLIVLGVLFLLGNFGVLSEHWFDRGWPILLIVLGIAIVIRRSQTLPPGGVR